MHAEIICVTKHHQELGRPVVLQMLHNPAVCTASCMHACMHHIKYLRTHFLKRLLLSSSFIALPHLVSQKASQISSTGVISLSLY